MRNEKESVSKRKYPRKAYKRALTFICAGIASTGRGVEIGEGGLSFSTDAVITADKKMIVNFFLSDKDFFAVRVTLLNILNSSKTSTYGVSFDDVSIALKRQIRAYVARTASI